MKAKFSLFLMLFLSVAAFSLAAKNDDNIAVVAIPFLGGHTIYKYPTIEFMWGAGKANTHSDLLSQEFLNNGLMDFRVGFTTKKINLANFRNSDIIDVSFNYLFLSRFSKDYMLGDLASQGKVEFDGWKFGATHSRGLAYKFNENSDLLLYNSKGIVWMDPNFSSDSIGDQLAELKNRFGDAIRFGNCFEAGVKYQIIAPLAIDIAYERTVLYPRHLFWYWTASEMIEAAGHGLVNCFVYQVAKSSPFAAPVVNFLLQNIVSYAAFELRKSKMNWPFDTSMPILTDSYKIGISTAF
ncbi:MAG: hypothetical protein GX121_08525 [Ignavibacteria bacterium]|nr:hypothetical protein [Ignavibacteria bacterium]